MERRPALVLAAVFFDVVLTGPHILRVTYVHFYYVWCFSIIYTGYLNVHMGKALDIEIYSLFPGRESLYSTLNVLTGIEMDLRDLSKV